MSTTWQPDLLHSQLIEKKLSKATLFICRYPNGDFPAIGGLRRISYPSSQAARNDCQQLAKAMLYKAKYHSLELSGGKAVIYCDDNEWQKHRIQILQEAALFIDTLNGQYITAIDMGTSPSDMDRIALITDHVCAHSSHQETAYSTALGVYYSIKAAYDAQNKSLSGEAVLLEGLGQVSEHLIPMLINSGCQIFGIEINPDRLQKFTKDVTPFQSGQHIDILCPNGAGYSISSDRVKSLGCSLVCGAANNQIVPSENADAIGCTYIPDFIANAGGLIYVAEKIKQSSDTHISNQLELIGERVKKHLLSEQSATAEC